LEQSLVRVVKHRDDRRVVEDQLLGPPVSLDADVEVVRAASALEHVVDDRVGVAEEIARAPRVEQLRQEVVGVGDVRVPGIEEDRQLALVDHPRERGPVGVVLELHRHPDRRQRLLDLFVLAQDVISLRAGPDRDGRQAPPAGVSGVGEQVARLLPIERVSDEIGIEASIPGGESPERRCSDRRTRSG
jgi:hypothetical protein